MPYFNLPNKKLNKLAMRFLNLIQQIISFKLLVFNC